MSVVRVEKEIGGRTLTLETGKIAKQSHGAVWVQYGDSVVLATVLTAPPSRDIDYFPLFVDYRENRYAAGKVPGGFFKREGRPSTKEVLTMRMIDRPIRPLFPADFMNEVQIQCMVLSTDNENDPDLLAMIGASAALSISPAPFQGPIGIAKIGYVDGEYVINPTHSDLEDSQFDLLVAGPRDAVNMLEMEGKEADESIVAEGIAKGFEVCNDVMDLIDELTEKVQPEKQYEPTPIPQELMDEIAQKYGDRLRTVKQIAGKVERSEALAAIKEDALGEYCPEGADPESLTYSRSQVSEALYKTEGKVQRKLILEGTRPDGRGPEDLRDLDVQVGMLPRTHGSAIFARGETMCLATCTLGTPRDEQIIDGLRDEYKKNFMLHYNFPPFSVGEIRPIRGPGRREIGHGALAEKSIQAVMPERDDFPYTVRLVADIMESNGSTSQAAVTGGSLALMDAGVPIKAPVAGISIGMVSEGDEYCLLTDIMGEEDFHGDMDFKVAGTRSGITGIQLDMKARGIPQDRIEATLAQAKRARGKIIDAIERVIQQPREEISQYAPRMLTIQINSDKIGKVIGPGGKTINRIQEETGATIDIEDDGTIYIACSEAAGAEAALREVEGLTAEAKVGKVYKGKVVSIRDFGAFIEILPGQDALCHVSDLDVSYVKNPADVVNIGDEIEVKCTNIDDQGRVKVSRKALLSGDEESDDDSGSSGGDRKRSGGGGGRGGRGNRRDKGNRDRGSD